VGDEKTHVPVSRSAPWPGGELPEWYKRTYDPFIALAATAATTTRLRIGTGVALLAVRDPVIAAKTVATLDWKVRWTSRPRRRLRLEP
jgi:alkanesulfonate monooxygenase SsuD/methylene tetrahydromethanopterin reductase-like flavin-dependent oxidoreductase (luciferase family)